MTDFYDWFTTSYFSIFLKVVILSLDAHAKKSAGYFWLLSQTLHFILLIIVVTLITTTNLVVTLKTNMQIHNTSCFLGFCFYTFIDI